MLGCYLSARASSGCLPAPTARPLRPRPSRIYQVGRWGWAGPAGKGTKAGYFHTLTHTASCLREKQGRGKVSRCGRLARARTHLPIRRGWPGIEAALSLIWRWRGVLEGELAEASGRLLSTWRCAGGCSELVQAHHDEPSVVEALRA
eukprot:scaffold19083_cov60-Phaeocystis_antarctica.AAC.2